MLPLPPPFVKPSPPSIEKAEHPTTAPNFSPAVNGTVAATSAPAPPVPDWLGGLTSPEYPPPPATDTVQEPVAGTLKELVVGVQLPVLGAIVVATQVRLIAPLQPFNPVLPFGLSL